CVHGAARQLRHEVPRIRGDRREGRSTRARAPARGDCASLAYGRVRARQSVRPDPALRGLPRRPPPAALRGDPRSLDRARPPMTVVRRISCCAGALLAAIGCAWRAPRDPTPLDYLGVESVRARDVERLRATEPSRPKQALAGYDALLAEAAPNLADLAHHRRQLAEALSAFDLPALRASIAADAALGFPQVYARRARAVLDAHLGKAHAELALGRADAAEATAIAAIEVALACGSALPQLRDNASIDAWWTAEQAREQAGRRGSALNARLVRELIDDFARSPRGREQFFREQAFVYGERTSKQFDAVQGVVARVNRWRVLERT